MKHPCPKCHRVHDASRRCSARAVQIEDDRRALEAMTPSSGSRWIADALASEGLDSRELRASLASLPVAEVQRRHTVAIALCALLESEMLARSTPVPSPSTGGPLPLAVPPTGDPGGIPDDWEPVTTPLKPRRNN